MNFFKTFITEEPSNIVTYTENNLNLSSFKLILINLIASLNHQLILLLIFNENKNNKKMRKN